MCYLSESAAYDVRLDEPVLRYVRRSLRAALRDGHLVRLEDYLMAEYQTHDYDVLVIGAGGAGLRAAIEASARECALG